MTEQERRLCKYFASHPEDLKEVALAATPKLRTELILRTAREQGLDISPEAVAAFLGRTGRELHDHELEQVVGGKKVDGDIIGWIGSEDLLLGSLWGDDMWGGDMNDTLFGYGGDDDMDGGEGDDVLYGGEGNDTMSGGGYTGNDSLYGGNGDDYMDGRDGDDILYGEDGRDTMEGGLGDDFMSGGDGDDSMHGDRGHDTLDGGDGNDSMDGGHGEDLLEGGAGNDTMDGSYQNDTLIGGAGDDVLTGGWGRDVFVFRPGDGSDIITDFSILHDSFKFEGVADEDIDVRVEGNNTIISFEGTTITVEGIQWCKANVLNRTIE